MIVVHKLYHKQELLYCLRNHHKYLNLQLLFLICKSRFSDARAQLLCCSNHLLHMLTTCFCLSLFAALRILFTLSTLLSFIKFANFSCVRPHFFQAISFILLFQSFLTNISTLFLSEPNCCLPPPSGCYRKFMVGRLIYLGPVVQN